MQFFVVTLVASILVLSQGEKPIDRVIARQKAIDQSCNALQPNTTGQMSPDNSCKFSCVDATGTTVIANNTVPNFAKCTLTEDEPMKGQCFDGQCEEIGSRPQPRGGICLGYGDWKGCYNW